VSHVERPRLHPCRRVSITVTLSFIIAAGGDRDCRHHGAMAMRPGEGTLRHARRTEAIVVTELPPQEAAPILKYGLATGPSILRRYFDITPTSTLDDYAREAEQHPVFQIHPAPATSDKSIA